MTVTQPPPFSCRAATELTNKATKYGRHKRVYKCKCCSKPFNLNPRASWASYCPVCSETIRKQHKQTAPVNIEPIFSRFSGKAINIDGTRLIVKAKFTEEQALLREFKQFAKDNHVSVSDLTFFAIHTFCENMRQEAPTP